MTHFRAATINDIYALNKLVNSAYRGESSKEGWTTEADLLGGQRTDPEKILEMINDPDSQVEMATDSSGEILGCVYLRKDTDDLYLGMLTVRPHLQAKGLGSQLLQRSEEIARKWNCHSIKMTVISIRKELIDFYKRRGFEETGKTEPFPVHDIRFGLPKFDNLIFHELVKKLV